MFHACDAMLTPKDVLYLEDLLDQTFVLNKRITNDVTMIQNEEVKTCFEEVNTNLAKHYHTLVELLQKEVKE